jgi:hypothetical protein
VPRAPTRATSSGTMSSSVRSSPIERSVRAILPRQLDCGIDVVSGRP